MIEYGGREMANAFRTVRKNTVQVAEDIPEDKYGFSAAKGTRTVAEVLKHVVHAPKLYEDMHRVKRITTVVGYDFGAMGRQLAAEASKPATKAEIVAQLKSEGERFASWLETLTPEFLAERFGDHQQGSRSRFESLLSPKEHEMHHRAQLMLVERMLGIEPHLTTQMNARRAAAAAAMAAKA